MSLQQKKAEVRCPYTFKVLSEENLKDQIKFTCGHVYHSSTFSSVSKHTFKCQVYGCNLGNLVAVVDKGLIKVNNPKEIIDIDEEPSTPELDFTLEPIKILTLEDIQPEEPAFVWNPVNFIRIITPDPPKPNLKDYVAFFKERQDLEVELQNFIKSKLETSKIRHCRKCKKPHKGNHTTVTENGKRVTKCLNQ